MCTAITFKTKDFYFGRTLDLDYSYAEEVTLMPRRFSLPYRNMPECGSHFAIIGMAHVIEDYPLYYDAVNEKGLAMAGLNFEGFALFREPEEGKDNVAQFELIPWILSDCGSVREAREKMHNLNITNQAFSEDLPPSPLHWILADHRESIVVESTGQGLCIYENPVGVLTNQPPFEEQLARLSQFQSLSPQQPQKLFSEKLDLPVYGSGMGGWGLPGDLSSPSRFVRAAFAKLNSTSGSTEGESVGQFFHIMDFVAQPKGCNILKNGKPEYTVYTSCCNTDKGIYYYTTYENRRIQAVSLHEENLEDIYLMRYPLTVNQEINHHNG